MTVMTANDRRATEKYLADLEREFGENRTLALTARDLGDMDGHRVYADKIAVLYREIREVEFALERDALPPYSDLELKRGEALTTWRSTVRRKHTLAADDEITRTFPEVVAKIDAALHAGEKVTIAAE
jgi:hypothetical protein